jgi:hypothetical protein
LHHRAARGEDLDLTASAGVWISKRPGRRRGDVELLPGTITSWPTSDAPCIACICMNCAESPATVC